MISLYKKNTVPLYNNGTVYILCALVFRSLLPFFKLLRGGSNPLVQITTPVHWADFRYGIMHNLIILVQ